MSSEDPDLDFRPLEDSDDLEFDIPPVIDPPPDLEDLLAASDDESDILGAEFSSGIINTSSGLVFDDSQDQIVPSVFHLDSISIKSKESLSSAISLTLSEHKKRPKKVLEGGNYLKHIILKGLSSQLLAMTERLEAGTPSVMEFSTLFGIGTIRGFIFIIDRHQNLRWTLGGQKMGAEYGGVSALAFNFNSTRLIAGFAKGNIIEFDLLTGKVLRDLNESHPIGCAILHTHYTNDPNVAIFADSGGSVYELYLKRTLGVRGFSSKCIFSGSRGEVCTVSPLNMSNQRHSDHRLSSMNVIALATISKLIILSLKSKIAVLFTHPLPGSGDTLPLLSWQLVSIQSASRERVIDPVIAFGRESTIYFFQMTDDSFGKIHFLPLSKINLDYTMISMGWLNTRCLGILDNSEIYHLYDVRSSTDLETSDLSSVQLVYGSSFFKGLATGGNVSPALALAGDKAVYGSIYHDHNQSLFLGVRSFHVLSIRSWKDRIDHLVESTLFMEAIELGLEFYFDRHQSYIGFRGSKESKKKSVANKLVSIIIKFLHVSMTGNFPQEGNMKILLEYFTEIIPPIVSACLAIDRKSVLFENVWAAYEVDPFSKAIFLESLETYILNDQLKDLPGPVTQEFIKHYEKSKRFQALEACITHISVTSLDIHQIMSVSKSHGLHDAIIYVYNNGMLDFVTPMEELLALLSENSFELGNKLLVYISCCLAGRAYPFGNIPEERASTVKYEVYTSLTALHSKKASETEPMYPHLRLLLSYDTQGLLNVISLAFEEKEFYGDMGRCKKQRLVDILLKLMVDGDTEYEPYQVGYLFTFLARQIAKDPEGLVVSRGLFDQVLDVLTREDTDSPRSVKEERQQALFDMILAGGLDYFDRMSLINKSERAGFYRILEMIYSKEKRPDKIIDTYIFDKDRKSGVFAYVQKMFLSSETNKLERTLLTEKIFDCINILSEIDVKKSAMIIASHFDLEYSTKCIEKLSSEALYPFLKHFFEFSESETIFPPELFDVYLKEMVRTEPENVLNFVKNNDFYSKKEIKKLCFSAKLVEASAYLEEKDGNIDGAFELLKEKLDKDMIDAIKGDKGLETVNEDVMMIVDLIKRNYSSMNDKEASWFALLESLMAPQRSNTDIGDGLKVLVKHLVKSSGDIVSLREMVGKILRDPLYNDASFSEIKDFLQEMVAMYHYEETLLAKTTSLLRDDIVRALDSYKKLSSGGISIRSTKCWLCQHPLVVSSQIIGFRCGHGYHLNCLKNSGCSGDSYECYSCLGTTPNFQSNEEDKIAREVAEKSNLIKALKYLNTFKNKPKSIFDSDDFPLKTAPGIYSTQDF